MLQPGHEGEFFGWLKDLNLIKTTMNCPTDTCNGKNMTWVLSRNIDKYSWQCPECKKKQSVRDKSFFHSNKFDLKLWMQITVAWCQSIPCEAVISHFGKYNNI